MKSCFLTVSCPINAFLASFSTTKNKTRENWPVLRCRKKSYQKLPSLHSSRSQTSLKHGPKVFLPCESQFSSKHRAMAPRGREKSLKDLNLPLRWIPSSPWWTTNWLSSYAVHSKFPWQGWPGGKSTNTKPDSQGYPGSAFAHFTKMWREKHRSPSRGFRTCSMATKPRTTPSIAHRGEERIRRRGKFKSFSDISRPLEAMAGCLELNWRFQGRKWNLRSMFKRSLERLEWNEGKFGDFFSSSVVEPSFLMSSSQLLGNQNIKTC